MASTTKLTKAEKQLRASSGFVKDYYKYSPSGTTNDAVLSTLNPSHDHYQAYLDTYEKDAIVAGAIDTVAEEAVKNRGFFSGSKTAIKQAEDLWEDLQFYDKAEVHVKTQHLYGDSYLEPKVGDDGKWELHNLETTEMWIQYNVHGDVIGYVQRPWEIDPSVGKLNKGPATKSWQSEDVIFMPLKPLGSKVHSYAPLGPATRAIIIRQYAHYFLQSVLQNFKPQTIYSIENNVSPDQVNSLVQAIRAADKDPSKKILSIGDVNVQTSGMYEFKKDFVDILNYVRQEVLTVTKVPGIYVGITDNSNRGVGEFEANAFQAHLLKVQRQIEQIANRILKKAGIKAKFHMKPPSIKSQTDVIDHAKKLRDMGYGDEVITQFLYKNGIDIPQDAKFEEANQISMDDYESRQGSDKGVTEGKFDLDENGRSDAGKEKQAEQDKSLRGALQRISKRIWPLN